MLTRLPDRKWGQGTTYSVPWHESGVDIPLLPNHGIYESKHLHALAAVEAMAKKTKSPAYILGVGMTKFVKPRGQVDYHELGYEVISLTDIIQFLPFWTHVRRLA